MGYWYPEVRKFPVRKTEHDTEHKIVRQNLTEIPLTIYNLVEPFS